MADHSTRDLQRALRDALAERDRALAALADARSELNRLRLQQQHPGEPPADIWSDAGSEALPLRYRVADRLNDATKRVLGPGHRAAKRALTRMRHR